ncbi:DUF7386 family protein [Halalkalirubrum salinum]|uniref:DUF7386 family protein n=1 Tax=Halalkalirubrum salinum TaxID=2563889 RepID=UPI0010FB0A69|nr:hypothetical protein [Halalkalirubrum salinum]
MGAKRTTIRLSDERQLLLDQASAIVASGPDDDPPTSDVIDAALTHLIESKENIEDARGDLDPTSIQRFNTSVLGLRYRTKIQSEWR